MNKDFPTQCALMTLQDRQINGCVSHRQYAWQQCQKIYILISQSQWSLGHDGKNLGTKPFREGIQ